MARNTHTIRLCFLGNPEKRDAEARLTELHDFAAGRCRVVGCELTMDGPAAVRAKADRIVVLGGDGTLIGVARSLGADQIPLVGINLGKLGFLTEFSPDEFVAHFDRIIHDDGLIDRRTVLHVTVLHNGGATSRLIAINDCVIQAGPPFRLITLGVTIDGEPLTNMRADGLIVCTPSGSTAHNLSAGGPIVQPEVEAIVLCPLNAHSLTHKPIVVGRGAVIEITAAAVNEGTTAIIDGQESLPVRPGDRVSIHRFETDVQIVRNPSYGRWHKLVTKLYWGRAPELT